LLNLSIYIADLSSYYL